MMNWVDMGRLQRGDSLWLATPAGPRRGVVEFDRGELSIKWEKGRRWKGKPKREKRQQIAAHNRSGDLFLDADRGEAAARSYRMVRHQIHQLRQQLESKERLLDEIKTDVLREGGFIEPEPDAIPSEPRDREARREGPRRRQRR